jgi:pSer/pThr/pTyr-binding forkhead associated (FHA) protein
MPKIIVTLPDGSRVTHELAEDLVTVGRTADNILQIEDASVSSHHAEIVLSGERHILRDLDSTNGTRVNEQPFTEGPLRDGDHVRFGKIDALYATDDTGHAQPLPEQEAVAASVAESSARPEDFSNASPFKTKSKKKDPIATSILALAVVAILAFAGAVFMILQLQPPSL